MKAWPARRRQGDPPRDGEGREGTARLHERSAPRSGHQSSPCGPGLFRRGSGRTTLYRHGMAPGQDAGRLVERNRAGG